MRDLAHRNNFIAETMVFGDSENASHLLHVFENENHIKEIQN